jgi:hypothetical protein
MMKKRIGWERKADRKSKEKKTWKKKK